MTNFWTVLYLQDSITKIKGLGRHELLSWIKKNPDVLITKLQRSKKC